MKEKIKVGILGATGTVGQNYLELLNNHPWFEVTFLAASPRSAGRKYGDLMKNRWIMDSTLPRDQADLMVYDIGNMEQAKRDCTVIFSAFNQEKEEIMRIEKSYAAQGFPVISNNSAHRMTPHVPMIIPEVNPHLLEIIPFQQKKEGWDKGFIITKPNCGVQGYVLALKAIEKAGFKISEVITTNLQALSGAGYPGQSAMDVIDNIIPLPGEEAKAFTEPQKIFGHIRDGEIISRSDLSISSNCIRVPVIHGHSSCLWFSFEGRQPELEEIEEALNSFRGEPQELDLPSAPQRVIRYFRGDQHPQPRKDRDAGKGMAVTVGRLQKSPVLGYRLNTLSHNTRRGAAGGGVLSAELLAAKGYIK